MSEKLHIPQFFSNQVMFGSLSLNLHVYNLHAKFAKILDICKQLSENLVNKLYSLKSATL